MKGGHEDLVFQVKVGDCMPVGLSGSIYVGAGCLAEHTLLGFWPLANGVAIVRGDSKMC